MSIVWKDVKYGSVVNIKVYLFLLSIGVLHDCYVMGFQAEAFFIPFNVDVKTQFGLTLSFLSLFHLYMAGVLLSLAFFVDERTVYKTMLFGIPLTFLGAIMIYNTTNLVSFGSQHFFYAYLLNGTILSLFTGYYWLSNLVIGLYRQKKG